MMSLVGSDILSVGKFYPVNLKRNLNCKRVCVAMRCFQIIPYPAFSIASETASCSSDSALFILNQFTLSVFFFLKMKCVFS